MHHIRPARKARNTREKCECGAYHFPHRCKGGACHLNPMAPIYDAARRGADDETIERLRREILEDLKTKAP